MKGKNLALSGLLVLAAMVQGAPFSKWFDHHLADGRVVRIHGEGDEFHAVFETEDGHTLVYNPAIANYEYVATDETGALVGTGLALGQENVARTRFARLKRHVRDTSDALKERIVRRVSDEESATGRAERWRARKARKTALSASLSNGGMDGVCVSAVGKSVSFTTPPETMVGVTILVDFPLLDAAGNQTNTLAATYHPNVTADDLREMVNGESFTKYGNMSSCRKYYETVSQGAFSYTNVVIGWVLAPNPRNYYDKPATGCGVCGRNLIGDILETIAAMPTFEADILPDLQRANWISNAGFLSSTYSIRALNIFFAGGEASTWSSGLWAHKYNLEYGQYSKLAIPIDGKNCYFYSYQIGPVTRSPSIYTFCHENGHMVCDFPDLYHYSSLPGNGVGMWDLMCGRTGTYDGHPQYLSAYLRAAMGWVKPKPLPKDSWVVVSNALDDVYSYPNPDNAREYYLIENRQAFGYDQEVRASGIAIYRCNENGDNTYPVKLSGTALQAFTEYGAATNRLSYEVSLEQADGLYSLESQSGNKGDAGDAWRADNPSSTYGGIFCATSVPCARWANGTPAKIALSKFSPNGRVMSFWSTELDTASVTTESPIVTAAAKGFTNTTTSANLFNLALDCDDVVFWTRANNKWFVESESAGDGKGAMRSADVEPGGMSRFYCSFTGPGKLSFDWKVACAADGKRAEAADRLAFFVSTNSGSAASESIRGMEGDWSRITYTFASDEEHCVSWRWSNAGNFEAGENCGRLDRVRWIPSTWAGEPSFGTACSYAKASDLLTFTVSLQDFGSNMVDRVGATTATARIEVADNPNFTTPVVFKGGRLSTEKLTTFRTRPNCPKDLTCYARLVVANDVGMEKRGRIYSFVSGASPVMEEDSAAREPKMEVWQVASETAKEVFNVAVTATGDEDEVLDLVAEFAADATFSTILQTVIPSPACVSTGEVTRVTVSDFPHATAVYVRLRGINASGASVASTQVVRHDYPLDRTDYDRWLKQHGYISRDYARSEEIAQLRTQVSKTGKCHANGQPMTVFDEYVAGTDPGKDDSLFRVNLKMTAEGPLLTWSPDLGDARVYKIYGKADLADAWSTELSGSHRFFKVAVALPADLAADLEGK